MSQILVIPLLGVLLWVLSLHSGSYSAASQVTNSPDPNLTGKHINDSSRFGEGVVGRLQRLEQGLGWAGIKVEPGTPSHGQYIVSAASSEALVPAKAAMVVARATQHLLSTRCSQTGRKNCSKLLTSYSLSQTPLHQICSVYLHPKCSQNEINSKYRSIDGSCSHFANEGMSLTSYSRVLFPVYLDGVMQPRRAVNKRPLPSARFISVRLVDNVDKFDKFDQFRTLAFMQWTEFVAHDMSHTVNSKMISTKSSIECCDKTGFTLLPRYFHPMCMPISIPSDDPFYSKHRTNCMSYVRSLPAIRPNCTFGPLEQMNQATHYLDGSQIYGSTLSTAMSIREFKKGRLLAFNKQGREYLPLASDAEESCQMRTEPNAHCYKAGDSRVNMQPHLTTMHTIWLRQHNKIAEKLSNLNPHWKDETIYQETRRIVVAQLQHITYNQWLPLLIGKANAEKIIQQGVYKPYTAPTVTNEFATVGLRFLGSLMTSDLQLFEENRRGNKSVRLQDHFNHPWVLETPEVLDGLVRGLATQHSQKMDLQFISDITQQLYRSGKFGMDSLSLDIQRGRDHGLPSYVDYREICGLKSIDTFDDLRSNIPTQTVEILKSVYTSPKDIDLLIGALSETAENTLLGPTFNCLITEQFKRTFAGDKYFYSHQQEVGSFTSEQLLEIRKTSLAKIFCDNGDDIKKMQRDVFSVISEENSLENCQQIPEVDLKKWKEDSLWINKV